MISESIRGILCQQLIPRKDGNGRALAMEILLNTQAVSNLPFASASCSRSLDHSDVAPAGMMLLENSLPGSGEPGAIDGGEAYYAADKERHFWKWAPLIDGIAVQA
jgi:twitching motility protein PilT